MVWTIYNETEGDKTINDVWDNPNRVWPSTVYIETTNNCNAHCLCCLNDKCKKNRGIMDFETFKLICAKIRKKPGLKIGAMFCFGEPLIDKNLFEKYKYARSLGLLIEQNVGLNTNVSLLTKEKFKDIIDNTTNITLSFFNTGSEFERLTGGLNWKKCYKNAIEFIKFRDKYKPNYLIYIGCNAVKGNDLNKVKESFKDYKVLYARDAECRWGGTVMTGVLDRMIMHPSWRCDSYKGALHIKWDGNVEFCAYDIVGTDRKIGETGFGNVFTDSWEELYEKFRKKFKNNPLCKRCDYWHHCKEIIKNKYIKPNPLPSNWYDWEKPFLKKGEEYIE